MRELVPATAKLLVQKNFNASFGQAPMDAELTKLSTTHIVLVVCVANWCIRAAAYGSQERGYDLTARACVCR